MRNSRRISRMSAVTVLAGAALCFAGTADATVPVSGIVDLGTLPSGVSSEAVAVNDRGTVIGNAYFAQPQLTEHAVRWDRLGHITDLGLPPGHLSTDAVAINDSDMVAGTSTTPCSTHVRCGGTARAG